VAEVAALKVADIDSERMLIRVERGKGGRYRTAMLPADLITLLRDWWKVGHQQGVMHRDGWLFPGPCCGGRMIITETFQRWMQPRGPQASPASTGTMTP
jgi:integrase